MSRSVWTPEREAAVRRLKAQGKTAPEIAGELDMKWQTVNNFCWRHGIGGGTPRKDGWLQRGETQPFATSRINPADYAAPPLRRFSWELSD